MEKKECCPKFYPKRRDGKNIFTGKINPFLKEIIPTFFHIPFPPMIGNKITKMYGLATEAKKVSSNKEEVLVLFRDPSAFKSEIYFSVTDKVAGANNVVLSGEFVGKVFSGGYNEIPKF
jgi:hypothetical protein